MFIERVGVEEYYVGINFDMVVGSFDCLELILMFVRILFLCFLVVFGVLEVVIELSNLRGKSFLGSRFFVMFFRVYLYEMGSDYDIFNFFGVLFVMLIIWFDRFYYLSGDMIDKVSREIVVIVERVVFLVVLFLLEEEKCRIE